MSRENAIAIPTDYNNLLAWREKMAKRPSLAG